MRKTFLLSMVALFGVVPQAGADVLSMPEGQAEVRMSSVPMKGMTMSTVRRDFGEPKVQHAPKGGGKRQHPPITRWDYDGFSVFFERANVIDVVVRGAPAPVVKTEELAPAQ